MIYSKQVYIELNFLQLSIQVWKWGSQSPTFSFLLLSFFLYLCFCHVYFNTLNLLDIRYYPHQSSHCRFVSFKEFYRYIRIFFLCFSQKTFDETLQKNNLKIFSSFLLNVKCLPNKHMRNPLLIYFCFCFLCLQTPNQWPSIFTLSFHLVTLGNFSLRVTSAGLFQIHSLHHLSMEGLFTLKVTKKTMKFVPSRFIMVHLEREEQRIWRCIWGFYFSWDSFW